MSTYALWEVRNCRNLYRGTVETRTLTGAKRRASLARMHADSDLVIENGDGVQLSRKTGRTWTDEQYY